jgi:hypothetical protein
VTCTAVERDQRFTLTMCFCCFSSGWRNELYAIYADPSSNFFNLPRVQITASVSKHFHNHVFSLERSACALFGVMTYGVHMTGEIALFLACSQLIKDGVNFQQFTRVVVKI